jgi:hypothetical protein
MKVSESPRDTFPASRCNEHGDCMLHWRKQKAFLQILRKRPQFNGPLCSCVKRFHIHVRMCVLLSLKIILAAFAHTYISVSMTLNYGDSNTQILFPFPLLRLFQGNFPSPWTCVIFRNMLGFLWSYKPQAEPSSRRATLVDSPRLLIQYQQLTSTCAVGIATA